MAQDNVLDAFVSEETEMLSFCVFGDWEDVLRFVKSFVINQVDCVAFIFYVWMSDTLTPVHTRAPHAIDPTFVFCCEQSDSNSQSEWVRHRRRENIFGRMLSSARVPSFILAPSTHTTKLTPTHMQVQYVFIYALTPQAITPGVHTCVTHTPHKHKTVMTHILLAGRGLSFERTKRL